jgi:hypothetical protein
MALSNLILPLIDRSLGSNSYVALLESEIASLERQRSLSRASETPANSPSDTPARSDNLIADLFQNLNKVSSDNVVQHLVSDVEQVSLSAMGGDRPAVGSDRLLETLIFNAALPCHPPGKSFELRYVALPPREISDRVISKYCQQILPGLPFITPSTITGHLSKAWDPAYPYSSFLIAIILATTAIQSSPTSTTQAVSLQRSAISRLGHALGSSSDKLRALEAVIALAQFAFLAGDGHSDCWALSGLAVQICVDFGLHKTANTDRTKRLFWCAYTIDRKASMIRQLPPAVPDAAIDTEVRSNPNLFTVHPNFENVQFPLTPHPFKLYWILSTCLCIKLRGGQDSSHLQPRTELERWAVDSRKYGLNVPSLERDRQELLDMIDAMGM